MPFTRRAFTSFLMAPLAARAADPPKPGLRVELGPEQLVAPNVQWPYLFQAREGATLLLGQIAWPPGGKYPLRSLSRSLDARRSWQEWKPVAGPGPNTEGSAVQLRNGRILIFDVHAEHI